MTDGRHRRAPSFSGSAPAPSGHGLLQVFRTVPLRTAVPPGDRVTASASTAISWLNVSIRRVAATGTAP